MNIAFLLTFPEYDISFQQPVPFPYYCNDKDESKPDIQFGFADPIVFKGFQVGCIDIGIACQQQDK